MGFRARYNAFDRYQRRHAWLGFPLAVRQKYSDDQGGYLAAAITYYGFFSIFPLLLALTSVLGFLLHGHPKLQSSIVHSALGQFPVIGHDLHVHTLAGSTLAVALGLAGALWAGMGVVLSAQNAMEQLWGIPFSRRPGFLRQRARASLILLAVGGGLLAATGLGGLGTVGGHFGIAWKLGSIAASITLNFALSWVALRLLTTRDIPWRRLRGGAIAAALVYEGLQTLGGYYVGHVLKHASNTYGTFALVIGLFSWIYLAVHTLLLAAEGNVVATRRLYPRSFSIAFEQPPTAGDKRALNQRAKVEQRRQDERIDVSFDDSER